MAFDSDVSLVAAAIAAGYLMTIAGVGKGVLRWRDPPPRCPACRHEQRDCICRESARRKRAHRRILW